MLTSVSLKNYKCFQSETQIEVAPLTVFCGINSSGKSSIIKSLLMLKQTAASKSSEASMMLSGDLVDCGIFDEVVNSEGGKKDKEFTIKNKFRIYNHKLETTGKYIKKQDAKAFNELRRIYNNIAGEIRYFEIEITLIVKKNKEELNEFSKYINNNYIDFYKIAISSSDLKGEEIQGSVGYIIFENSNSEEHHKLSWKNIPGFTKAVNSFDQYKCTCSFNGLAISNIFAYEMPNKVKAVVPNLLSISRIAFSQYDGINYIAPLRNNPERTYLIKKNVSSVGTNGEDTPILLAKIKNKKVNSDIFCPYINKVECDENGYINTDYHSIIQQWLDYFETGKLTIDGGYGVINVNVGEHNISDIGFGMSQLLPIVTQGIVMDKEQTLMVEQPEIHLHPKMELQMADFLIELAKTKRNVIIETHSDHIINRLIRRVMEDYTLKDIVKIYFIENKEDGTIIHEPIEIDECKGTKNEYVNFFTQYTTETSEIMRTGLENMLGK